MASRIEPIRTFPFLSIVALLSNLTAAQQSPKRIYHEVTRSNVNLGGLFPVHTNGLNGSKCGHILLNTGVQRVEAMLYAIDQINSNFSYWNFRMGAIILDTCNSETYAIEESLQFLHCSCFNTNVGRKITAVVGASHSSVTSSVANIFTLFQLPQVSYASTSRELDDLDKFPYFFRVVPSDRFQVKVILDILRDLKWTFVSLVVSKGKYGESAAQYLRELIRNSTNDEICIFTQEIVSRDAGKDEYKRIVKRLDLHDKAKVVITFLHEVKVRYLLEACEESDIPENRFVWLGSDSWGTKAFIAKGMEKRVEGAITILPKRFPETAGFDSYFKSLKPSTNTRNEWFQEFWEAKFNCSFLLESEKRNCTGNENMEEFYQQEGLVPMVIDSVFLLAHAIRSLCNKHIKMCTTKEDMDEEYRRLLVAEIANTTMDSVQGNNAVIRFDADRNILVNYTIYQFSKQESGNLYAYSPIGEWNVNERLKFSIYPKWRNADGGSLWPESVCSKECKIGEERIPDNMYSERCCWTCRPCPITDYISTPKKSCTPCPEGSVPSEDRMSCVDPETEYLGQHLDSAWALIPLIFSILGLAATSGVLVVFILYRKTPIIMASGRELCYIILFGIFLCYFFPFIVLLKPSTFTCGFLRVGMGLGLAVCYSAIFTKTNRLSRIFEVSMKSLKRPSYISPESQIIICVCLILIQLTLTVLWLIVKPPKHVIELWTDNMVWIAFCELDGNSVLLGLLYNIVLLILCTIYAYKTRRIPENFSESKWISFTMFASCIVWLAFIPIYLSATGMQKYRVQSSVLSMTVSISGTVTLVCIFIPKIYIVLFHPERNVRYPGSSANTGTGTCDSQQPVRFLRTIDFDPGLRQPTMVESTIVPFTFKTQEGNTRRKTSLE